MTTSQTLGITDLTSARTGSKLAEKRPRRDCAVGSWLGEPQKAQDGRFGTGGWGWLLT